MALYERACCGRNACAVSGVYRERCEGALQSNSMTSCIST